MFDLLAPFLIGFVGSLHCLGMCGPLIMAYSLSIPSPRQAGSINLPGLWSRGLSHHILFHSGRIISYALLGGLAAALAHLTAFQQFFTALRSGLTLGGGILMVLLGLILLKAIPFPVPSPAAGRIFGRVFPPLFRSHHPSSKLILGFASGFLPCMLSWAMIVKAATTLNPVQGFLTLFSFGLGTIPILFFTGLSASLLSLRVRFLGERIAAAAVIIMGLILIFKGSRYFV